MSSATAQASSTDTGEAALGDRGLPDCPRIPASAETQLDGFPVRLASAGAGTVICTREMLPRFAA